MAAQPMAASCCSSLPSTSTLPYLLLLSLPSTSTRAFLLLLSLRPASTLPRLLLLPLPQEFMRLTHDKVELRRSLLPFLG